ncbi:hypothetical protein HY464_01940, partial [Candidatus Peregrinibacteria bacterium]|nr:hypothetical protein [Candidatus Peregrinibacteria bacterium]
RLGIAASTRLSVALYNTFEEIDRLPAAIERAKKILTGKTTNYLPAGQAGSLQTTH